MGGIFGKSGMHAGLLTKAGAMKQLKSSAIENNPALREQMSKDRAEHSRTSTLKDVKRKTGPSRSLLG